MMLRNACNANHFFYGYALQHRPGAKAIECQQSPYLASSTISQQSKEKLGQQ